MPIIPIAEYKPDLSDFQANSSASIQNVVPRGDGYGPFPDFTLFSDAAAATCRGFFRAIKDDGTSRLFMGTINRLYLMDNTTLAWGDVTKDTPLDYSDLSDGHNWQFAQFGDLVIAVQANVAPQVFDLSSSTEFDDLAGTPPQAAYISIVGRFVVLSGLLSEPYRVHWSGLNAVTTWTSGTSSSDFQDLPDGGVVRGVAGGEYGTIFQDGAIRRMIFAPGSPLIFQIERVSEDIGLLAPYSVVRSGHHVFFLSTQGFQKIGPGGIPEPIGRERVDRTFLAEVDRSNYGLLQGASDPRSTRVYWAYRQNGGSAALFDSILIYDWAIDRWSTVDMSGEYLGSMAQPGMTLDGLDALYASIDDIPFSLDTFSPGTTPEVGMFNSAHTLGFFRGANLEATLESAEYGQDGKRFFVSGFRPITDAPTVYGWCSKRETMGDTRTHTTGMLVNARTGLVPQRFSTRYSRAILRIPAGETWTFVQGLEPEMTITGEQ
jgi:hypothetical protein